MTPQTFIAKWKSSELKERSASQEQFIDLCRLLGHATPAEADPKGERFCFERGASKQGGGNGWADVWLRGHFAWEYKGKDRDLAAAYQQLLRYREALENPPLLIVSDMDRFEIHTNFTGTVKKVYAFSLDALKENIHVIRWAFFEPERLRPKDTPDSVTQEAAKCLAPLALSLERRGHAPHAVAHFLMRLVFCMFAEDIGLLPDRQLAELFRLTRTDTAMFAMYMRMLFAAMKSGSHFNMRPIPHFNGGLFDSDDVIELNHAEIELLYQASCLDWSGVEPAIFGTLFERSLDPGKRAQLGAHYTSPEDILSVIEPVILDPLRREWTEARVRAEAHLRLAEEFAAGTNTKSQKIKKHIQTAVDEVQGFLDRLRKVRVLDPACGSGNFLYMALRGLKDLEGEVIEYASAKKLATPFPFVSPTQFYGIEFNPYAYELAQIVVWIGHLQWYWRNGWTIGDRPILKTLDNIRNMDAILGTSPLGDAATPEWPEAEFIVGNPPFIGGKLLRENLGDEYVSHLFEAYSGRVPREADLVCYWLVRAREQIRAKKARRAGFVTTNSIRGGANRMVLDPLGKDGHIFMAWADRPWVLEGAAVRVSMVAFDDGGESSRTLDGVPVTKINSNLTAGIDVTITHHLRENLGLAFMGDTKGGKFEISGSKAREWLELKNPGGRRNADVLRRWANGYDIARGDRDMWIIDFGTEMAEAEAALYEAPYEHVRSLVKPARVGNKRAVYAQKWWIHSEARPAMRTALAGLPRYLATVRHMKHRLFVFLEKDVLADSALIAIARSDWFTFGVLSSRVHELWSLRLCTWIGVGNDPRYTPSTTFETFPFPVANQSAQEEVSAAAQELDELRKSALAADPGLTLTELYNKNPTWLRMRHEKLDHAVLRAYDWPVDLTDEALLARLLSLNLAREPAGLVRADEQEPD